MASRRPILLTVEEAIDGLVELRVADECQIMDGDDRADTLCPIEPHGELVGEPVEEVDLMRPTLARDGEVAPDIPPSEGQRPMRSDEPYRAMGEEGLVERWITRGGREEQVAILGAVLREHVQHEATVVPESRSVVRDTLGIKGDIHRQEGDEGGFVGEREGARLRSPSCSGRGGRRARSPPQHRRRRHTSSCSSQRGSPSCPSRS